MTHFVTREGGMRTELRGRRNPHTFVRLQIAAWFFLALSIWSAKELLT